jgi:anaerobic C4-dicarboxylate transporter
MDAVTPTMPLVTPYKMGKFYLSHRYLITHAISLFFNVQYGFVYIHFLEFAWFDVDDLL